MPVKGLPPSGADDIINLSFSAGFGGGGSMEKQKPSFKAYLWEKLNPENLLLFGGIYFILALGYHFIRPQISPFCQQFLNLLGQPRCSPYFFLKLGLLYCINVPLYCFGVFCSIKESMIGLLSYIFPDISIMVTFAIFVIGLGLKKYEEEVKKYEEKRIAKMLNELMFLPPKEAVKRLRDYYSEIKEGEGLNKLSDIVREKKEDFLEAALEIGDKKIVDLLSESLGEQSSRLKFLRGYLGEDWKELRTNLPNWLEEFWKEEKWRKAIYEAAAKCYEAAVKSDAGFTAEDLWKEWFKPPSSRKLLQVLSEGVKLPEDKQRLLGPRVEIPWPREKERPENPNILIWCKAMGIDFNPFGPEYAEEDHLLSKYYVFPDFWDRFLQPYPTLVLGPEGSGKSALGLYLAHHLRESYKSFQDKTLAILMPATEPAPEALPFSIAETLALRTIELVARNPFAFLEAPMSQKGPLIRLWLSSIPNIRAELAANGLDGRLLYLVAEEVERLGPGIRLSYFPLSMLIELLSPLIPLLGEFKPIYLVTDLKALLPESYDLTLWLEQWVFLTPSLLRAGFYPKILCVSPYSFAPQEFARTVGWEWDVFVLDWDEAKLVKMVEERIRATGRASFDEFCKPPLRGVAEKMAKAAKGSPRKLIRLGNEILLRAAEHLDDPLITTEDLKGILL